MALNFFKQRDIDEMDVNDIPEEFINYLETLDEAGKIGLLASRPDIAKVLGVSVEDSNQDTVNTTDDSSEIVQEDERNPKSSAVFEEEQDIRNSVNVEPDVDEPEEVNEEFIAIQNNYYEGKRLAEILKDNMEPLEALAIPDKTDKCFIHRVPFKEKQIRYTGKGATYGVTHFAEKVKNDQFAFRYYESKVSELEDSDKLPTIASYIEKDFNEAWFNNLPGIRSESENVQRSIAEGVSPFKAEIAEYINSISVVKNEYQEEVKKLQNIAKNNISGVITTNYDCFFEILFDGYKTFIGQDELVFSQLQGVAEIYKIHGSVRSPLSIVINKNDYHTFREKGKYLAAKLMTIFMEYPIVFIGYSISDSDIQEILGDVVECLPPEKVNSLQKRFIFIDYQKDTNDCEVSSHSLVINGKLIEMTKIILSDFGILYDALSAKKAALPVKLLRRFKDELYSFALTQQPGPTMQVAALDDGRIDENMLALSIGLASTGVYGLARAVNSEQWYRNIILHDSMYSCDKLLEYVYPELAKQNSWKLPVWYYIANSDYKSSLAESKAPHSYNDIVSEDSIKRNRTAIAGRTAMEIWTQEKTNVFKAIRLLGFLPEDKIDVEQYQQILETIFKENANILSSSNTSDRSSLKRMIRIYDFLLYRQKKTP